MRTRTLLLLAVGCGLVILLAGGIQLLRIANQDEPAAALVIGDTGRAGDAIVVLRGFSEPDDLILVEVTLWGVDDPDGLAGFGLVAPGVRAEVLLVESSCGGFTVAESTCTLAFSTEGMKGDSRQLVFSRAEETVRWVLKS